ncbi:septum formation protein [Desulfotomaculum arcticum]|uniref:dTTP/UTP pyrophosphatase n=1 Tax=Desulfotruncus arcticus DSM 17038 TaxID=1121424 RepID=A0A1I2UHA1_9FIRM|nr:Maf family protein [Desulfotruncus arcticus]SFG76418.1 septum formation protein [Desulfotomaculum arcticum] [Desulfotruncus arcticus DSM 17038]
MPEIYLASSSPRRRELLGQIKLPHQILTMEVDETLPPGIPPAEQVLTLSRRKALAAAEKLDAGIVIAADTVVALDEIVLGKPRNAAEALDMLERLQGKAHEVFSGITLLKIPGNRVLSDYERTEVIMRRAGRAELARYIATGEPMDKAGAYGIQGLAAVFVTGIKGCYYNVVGLPVAKLVTMLREFGINVTACWG